MSAPFWIHCNICNALFKREDRHFLLSCTHILCKSCMKRTNGKKCPICKCSIRFEDMNRLPDNLKKNFQTDARKLLSEPAKILQFQQNHMKNLVKTTRDYKIKHQRAMQIYEKQKKMALQLKKQFEECCKRRRLMQEKLKEIYVRRQIKRQREKYLKPYNSTTSSGFFSNESSRRPSIGSHISDKSDFFNRSSQMGIGLNTSSDDFFGRHPAKKSQLTDHADDFFRRHPAKKSQITDHTDDFFGRHPAKKSQITDHTDDFFGRHPAKKSRFIEHTQSDRTPFFV